MESCIFEGRVRHTRRLPVRHSFVYRIYMMYLDLDELDGLFDRYWLWSASKPAIARFRREDHLGDPQRPLADCVRELVAERCGRRPTGPVRLLTHLSYFGYCFNPVSFYYCYDEEGRDVEAIVAEVSNTPWGEQHCYVLPSADSSAPGPVMRFSRDKQMHVSPFMDMDIDYDWSFGPPGEQLQVFMANDRDGERLFDAGMRLERREIGSASLARVLLQYPLMTLRVMVAIHWQALKLWLKRVPFYSHPSKRIKTVTTR